LGEGRAGNAPQSSREGNWTEETRLPMGTRIMKWVSLTALVLVASWRPSANYQILAHFLVCAGAVMVVLALFFIKPSVETHCAVENRSDVGQQITLRR
jgi:hypothetical protein